MSTFRLPWMVDAKAFLSTRALLAAAQEAQQKAARELKKQVGPGYYVETVQLEDDVRGPRGYAEARPISSAGGGAPAGTAWRN